MSSDVKPGGSHGPPSETLVAIESVSKHFVGKQGTTAALQDVSLTVRKGEFISLLGPSGCGKTTLLNLVAGFLKPDAGGVTYGGERVDGPNRNVGYLTQDDALLPWRSVRANVALPLEIKGVAKDARAKRANEMLERVGLSGFEAHFPHQLSGGMRKRVSMARTLIYQPQTLLLDEPFGALDAQTRGVMQKELLMLTQSLGLTVLLVTHDLNEAVALSDRIALFSKRPARILDIFELSRRIPAEIDIRSQHDDEISSVIRRRLSTELEPPPGAAGD
jgi:NitT/TauT family transport system ATP-binding protein